MRVNVIIPVYNEEEVVGKTLSKVVSAVKPPCRVIVVDDGSTDKTADIIKEFQKDIPDIFFLLRQDHKGFAKAVKSALCCVPAEEFFVTVMADGCDQIDIIEDMRGIMAKGQADVVCACRYMPGAKRIGGSLLKAIGSRLVNMFFFNYTRGSCRDATNSFKMFKKGVLSGLALDAAGFDISLEMILRAYSRGGRIIDVPTVWVERSEGVSKFRIFGDGYKYLRWMVLALSGEFRRNAEN